MCRRRRSPVGERAGGLVQQPALLLERQIGAVGTVHGPADELRQRRTGALGLEAEPLVLVVGQRDLHPMGHMM
jgi:hypothetical protein